MAPDLEQQIGLLLGNFSKLSPRIQHLTFNTRACGALIEVRCSYITFRDGQPTFADFIDVVSDHIIPFCLPRSEIRNAQRKIAKGDLVTAGRVMAQLAEKARSLFIKAKKGSHRSGEAGEIVLYILTEWLLKAPQIVSKMYLKTNNQMPVYGTDGIHARYDHDLARLYLYWGESKARPTVAAALGDALDSIKEFLSNGQDKREIEIVATHSDLGDLDADTKEAILQYLDPYEEKSNERVIVHSCLLAFESNLYVSDNPEEAESRFIDSIRPVIEKFITSVNGAVTKKGLGNRRFEFFLLPVPSVQQLRDRFQSNIGWPHD